MLLLLLLLLLPPPLEVGMLWWSVSCTVLLRSIA
jgi:hypothetical protein